MYARPSASLPRHRYKTVRHVHTHRHTVTVTHIHRAATGMADSPASGIAMTGLNGSADGMSSFPTSMHTPPGPIAPPEQAWPLPPKPQGFWAKASWQAQRGWRFICLRVWPVILTVIDFVLRRTTVGFLFRPMDGSGS